MALADDPHSPPAADAGAAAAPLQRDRVAGLEKGLAVIEAFDQERPRLTIAEVADRTGLTRAAARRYLITLQHLGFVSQDRKMFALTAKVLRLSQSYMHSARLPRIVQPELHQLSLTLKEASSAGVLDGNDVLCIAATNGGRNVSATLQPGTRVPAYCTSNGRVLLAGRPQAEVEAWVARQRLQSLTPFTCTDPARLAAAVARARADGHACVDQELELGLRTVSVPLIDHRGEVAAALNISVHAARMTMDDLLASALPPLQLAQARLRQLL
ncbi:IclR family transcriptional regulator C-terminal domain-containing protein [Aquabacterium sp. J223]|uniref:IclR family transcriptional regulator domain-containing protein n=1 Tax=Aquabacterium sp. J223 TaxID=2898431 RepID=UPI0021AE283C|nr:IclR family transcriptional regulator C-terminal domain-containing protein [Aquabacterium sp. J223]UUX95979.1 helix-turn-helix domain-containing protein [Aquabacterium sp. J223]